MRKSPCDIPEWPLASGMFVLCRVSDTEQQLIPVL